MKSPYLRSSVCPRPRSQRSRPENGASASRGPPWHPRREAPRPPGPPSPARPPARRTADPGTPGRSAGPPEPATAGCGRRRRAEHGRDRRSPASLDSPATHGSIPPLDLRRPHCWPHGKSPRSRAHRFRRRDRARADPAALPGSPNVRTTPHARGPTSDGPLPAAVPAADFPETRRRFARSPPSTRLMLAQNWRLRGTCESGERRLRVSCTLLRSFPLELRYRQPPIRTGLHRRTNDNTCPQLSRQDKAPTFLATLFATLLATLRWQLNAATSRCNAVGVPRDVAKVSMNAHLRYFGVEAGDTDAYTAGTERYPITLPCDRSAGLLLNDSPIA